jgi:hypothetical protein
MRRFQIWAFWTLVLTAGLVTTGCNHGKCNGVTCSKAESCDPTDGICKCGAQAGADGGIGGTICGPNENCDLNLQTCVGNLCEMKLCSNGNVCDSQDGICKCGGQICPADQICDNTSHHCVGPPACQGVICGTGSSCDPADGKCKCNGTVCGAGNICLAADAGGCQPDPCYGVHCAAADEGIQCIQGVCRCGSSPGNVTVNDPVCSRVQHCSSGMCTAILGCDAVPPCYGYNVCNPLDLQCHCGSRLSTAKICQPGEVCQSYGAPGDPPWEGDAGVDAGQFFSCRGVNDCHMITCVDGTICDPNLNFNCACETAPGLQGPPCQQNEYCLGLDPTVPPICTQKCNPYVQQECLPNDAGFTSCYAEFFDGGNGAGVCENPNPNSIGAVGDNCGVNADCQGGLGCWTRPSLVNGDAGPVISTCQPYCDNTSATMAGMYPCTPPQYCTPIGLVQATGQQVQIGFCQ